MEDEVGEREGSHPVRTAMTSAKKDALRRTNGVPFPETQYGIVKRIQVVEEWVRTVRERMGKSRLSILDYGCGTGDHITFPLAHWGNEVLGIDIHEPSILEARRKYALPNLSFRTGKLQDLLKDGLGFDVIVCSEVLEHLHDPGKLLEGLDRLLGKDGALIVTTPNGYGSFEMLRRLERTLTRIGVHQGLKWTFQRGEQMIRREGQDQTARCEPELGFLNQDSVHVQFFRLRSLERLFFESGFRIVRRRARTFFCGPYADAVFRIFPGRQTLFRLNNRLADVLPFSWAADWMFLLEQKENTQA